MVRGHTTIHGGPSLIPGLQHHLLHITPLFLHFVSLLHHNFKGGTKWPSAVVSSFASEQERSQFESSGHFGAFLCRACMLSSSLQVFSLDASASSLSPKTCRLNQLVNLT